MINQKYSYNGYDPKSEGVLAEKVRIKNLFNQRILNIKQYTEACTAMKRGWKKKSLLDVDPAEFNNTEIVQTSFEQVEPNTEVFPAITGVTFRNCNLNNCVIPSGNTVEGGCNKQHVKQKDGEEWVVDKDLNPVEPLSPKQYDDLGLSKDPKDLPAETMEQSIILQATTTKVIEDRKARVIALADNPDALATWAEKGGDI